MATVTIWEASGANGGKKASLEQLTALLTQGESVNQPDWAGCTPLHCAAPEGNFAILTYLLEHGAEVNKTTPYGLTPLHFACYYGRLENAKVLLAYGANLGAQTHDGFSPKDKAHEGQRSGRATGPQNKYAEVIDLLTRCEMDPREQQLLMQSAV
jgi:ankyrin repeat protein